MTTQELKQEAIKKAYGEHWDKAKDYIDMDGWVKRDFLVIDSASNFDFRSYFTANDTIRPKSLSGIENNNGWTRIEDGFSQLKDMEEYHIMSSTGSMGMGYYSTIGQCFCMGNDEFPVKYITHFQPIIKPEPPLY